MDASRVDGTLPSILTESLTSLASHTTSTTAPNPAGVQSTTGMLGGLLLGVFTIVPSLLYWIVSFITITLPTWIFSFLSRSFTLTLNMTTADPLAGLCFHCELVRSISIPQHVFEASSRATA
jgi:hypothetical protein